MVFIGFARMDIFNMNVENEWLTIHAHSLYFPKDHSFSIPKETFFVDSMSIYLVLCLCALGKYQCVRITGNIIELFHSYLFNAHIYIYIYILNGTNFKYTRSKQTAFFIKTLRLSKRFKTSIK